MISPTRELTSLMKMKSWSCLSEGSGEPYFLTPPHHTPPRPTYPIPPNPTQPQPQPQPHYPPPHHTTPHHTTPYHTPPERVWLKTNRESTWKMMTQPGGRGMQSSRKINLQEESRKRKLVRFSKPLRSTIICKSAAVLQFRILKRRTA